MSLLTFKLPPKAISTILNKIINVFNELYLRKISMKCECGKKDCERTDKIKMIHISINFFPLKIHGFAKFFILK